MKTTQREATDWKLCILCHESTSKGEIVKNPRNDSFQKLLDVVQERASLQDGTYVATHEHLKHPSRDSFIEKKPVWHRNCYSDATNQVAILRARDRLEHEMFTGSHVAKKRGHKRTKSEMEEASTQSQGGSVRFTRSATEPLTTSHCFFCQPPCGFGG